ncbi:MAG: thioredoxin family protein [Saprospiraceae bacterium]|nr:thioredoxin family protein [Saprospiraceae bacterium]MCF8252391.1 thioredoxin family protein [Saprospiraceae bacterium]MCF8282261.1 thioredoxin family protein [Bacteroidales bacterium]MCF8313985.1 thioredoxin family protein [Saprospiraceae bacterium]MCF8442721.1 thioredoxin family protein [Saprospiraceae bacterium]
MRKFWTLSLLLAFAATAFGQIYDPVKWSFSSKQLSDTEFSLVYTATIQDGWYIYSQYLDNDDGPTRTTFTYEKGSHFSLSGKNVESSSHRMEMNDPLFDNMHVVKFAEKVSFTQKVKVTDVSKPITGYLTFGTCDNMRCLPPADVDFSFQLKSNSKPAETKATTPAADKGGKTNSAETAAPATNGIPQVPVIDGGGGNILNPVGWTSTIEKTGENQYVVNFKAAIEKGWSIYSQFVEDGGPIPTSLTFDTDENLQLNGKAAEISSHKIEGLDPFFDMKVTKFKEEVTFSQKFTVKDPAKPVKGYLTFMTCNDERCLPPVDVPFLIDPAGMAVVVGAGAETSAEVAEADSSFAYIGDCGFKLDKAQMADCGEQHESSKKGYWKIFILGFLGGLAALLTPCVFPMVPLTVSFFTKSDQSKKKGFQNAALYGFFILLVYVLFSLPFHVLDSVSPDILNEFSTNVTINLLFFAIFLVFAISFFGYFEITLPESWSNKAASAEGVGGILGIFFMALTLVLVSFSCTGPILGSLLGTVLDSDAGAMQLTAGMAGFGVALGLPFGLFAAFPNWLKALPKSGGWMTTVKVVLGFLELALALKFLSNADLVKHWGILKIEVFLGLWIVIFIALGLYLLGKIRFPHDSPLKKIPPVRLVLAILSFVFAGYMATGLRYDEKAGSLHSLTLLSGLAPPACYSIWYPCDCPQNLQCFKDFCEGLEFARKENKPIMIDFTGHACANCRRMEETVWPKKEVYNYLKDEYVVISLYVDEKIELPADQQKSWPLKGGGTQRFRNVGHKWAYFQRENFNDNSQPQYVLITADGVLLNQPVSGMQEVDDYAHFLKCGLDKFKELNVQK